jgi:hypothetical protein
MGVADKVEIHPNFIEVGGDTRRHTHGFTLRRLQETHSLVLFKYSLALGCLSKKGIMLCQCFITLSAISILVLGRLVILFEWPHLGGRE